MNVIFVGRRSGRVRVDNRTKGASMKQSRFWILAVGALALPLTLSASDAQAAKAYVSDAQCVAPVSNCPLKNDKVAPIQGDKIGA